MSFLSTAVPPWFIRLPQDQCQQKNLQPFLGPQAAGEVAVAASNRRRLGRAAEIERIGAARRETAAARQ